MTNRCLGLTASLVLLLVISGKVTADQIRVAVASNFAAAMAEIKTQFEGETGHQVLMSVASTGKHYAQVHQGAPFDAFFSADAVTVQRLLDEGQAVAGSDFVYARGQLVLWYPSKASVDLQGKLAAGDFRHLAIANPRLAPYGRAAMEALQQLGVWEMIQPQLVRGENIAQAFQFVHSGNAEWGLLAASQQAAMQTGSQWLLPETYHSPIEQRAVLLRVTPAAEQLLSYFKKPAIRQIIASHGYQLPSSRAP